MIAVAAADTLVLFLAASLTKPLQPVLDSFAARTGTVIQRESGATLEHVRKITELRRTPDLLLLADADVFPRYLVPKYASWYADFARNRMVVAYTPRSRYAKEINPSNWMQIVTRPDVEVGRSDPDQAPVGYRTLIMFGLADLYYKGMPNIGGALLTHAPPRNVRSNAADLAALLGAGELDYIYDYQSVAESNGFDYVRLPNAIDLGDLGLAKFYARSHATIRGSKRGETVIVSGEPIVYGLTIPRAAPHAATARNFLAYLRSSTVIARLRAAHVDMLDPFLLNGTGAPPELRRESSPPRR